MPGLEDAQQPPCQECGGSGVVTVKGGPLTPLMAEAGVFCADCDSGIRRWQATLTAIRDCEADLINRPLSSTSADVVNRQTRVFVGR